LAEVDSLLSEFILDDLVNDNGGPPTAPKSIKEQLTSTAPSFATVASSPYQSGGGTATAVANILGSKSSLQQPLISPTPTAALYQQPILSNQQVSFSVIHIRNGPLAKQTSLSYKLLHLFTDIPIDKV
jgi:hypothetical protein